MQTQMRVVSLLPLGSVVAIVSDNCHDHNQFLSRCLNAQVVIEFGEGDKNESTWHWNWN